ncbi:MAG: HflC protein [Treponema sp.]|nr:MAG: HflC protein [Treponema sp.]
MSKKSVGKITSFVVILLILIFAFFVANPFYILNENEAALITQMGAIVKTESSPGMHFKIPIIQQAHKYTLRLLRIDGDPKEILTRENQYIVMDTTSRWRITNVQTFYQSLKTQAGAMSKLADIIDSAVRDVISVNSFDNVVRSSNIINEISAVEEFNIETDEVEIENLGFTEKLTYPNITKGRMVLAEEIVAKANAQLNSFGIEVVDIIFKRIKYSDELQPSVFNRMITERNQIAESFRSTGEGKKAELLGKLENEKLTILSQAYAESERIKGLADAEASAIYAQSYNKNPEFYSFWKSLEMYKKTLLESEKILSTDLEYFDYLYKH